MTEPEGEVFALAEGGLVRVQVDNPSWEPADLGLTYAYLSPDDARKLANEILRVAAEAEGRPYDPEED